MENSSWDTVFRDSTRFWVQYILVPVVVLVGVLGNTVTICILTRKQMRISSNIYLTALAISDLLFLVFSFSMSWKHYYFMKTVRLYWNYIPLGLWVTDASSSTSVWLTVSFTVERYVAVCHPMLVKAPLTERRALCVCIFVYALCFLLTASTPFEWKSVLVTTAPNSALDSGNWTTELVGANETDVAFTLVNTELGKNAWYRFVYHWFTTITFVIVPLIILAIGNLFLIYALRKSRKEREALTNQQFYQKQYRTMRQEDKITVTLIAIIIVFLICQMPTAIVLIYTAMHTPVQGSTEDNVLLGLGNIFNFLVAVNAACNFILYTALSAKYRRVFVDRFCCSSVKSYWHRRMYREQTIFTLPRLLEQQNRLILCNTSLIGNHGSYPETRSATSGERIFCSSGTYHVRKNGCNGENNGIKSLVFRKQYFPRSHPGRPSCRQNVGKQNASA